MYKSTRLSRRINSLEDLEVFTLSELKEFAAAHDQEIIKLKGELEVAGIQVAMTPGTAAQWAARARKALALLKLHKQWILDRCSQLAKAEKEEKSAKTLAALREVTQAQKELKAARHQQHMENAARKAQKAKQSHQEAQDENARHIAVFKEVAREVLGMELYMHLWELTERRLNSGVHDGQ